MYGLPTLARRNGRGLATLLAGVLLLTSCDSFDALNGANESDAALTTTFSAAESQPTQAKRLVSNRTKYRDAGNQPSTGRAGSAIVYAQALAGRDGATEILISTAPFQPWGMPSGMLGLVQIKALDIANPKRAHWVRNHHESGEVTHASYVHRGLPHGAPLQIQAQVRTLERRTGVITLDTRVSLRPDLAVRNLTMPDQARMLAPVVITSTIHEINGEVGAWADCVLYVDGIATDWIGNMWVDAGGVVNCAFAPVFEEVGTRRIDVVVENVRPGDWDTANNTETGYIEILGPGEYTGFRFYAVALADVEPRFDRSRYEGRTEYLSDGSYFEYGHSWESESMIQDGYLSAWMDRKISFPITSISVRQSTDGTTLHAASISSFPLTWGYSDLQCGEQYWNGESGTVSLGICSGQSWHDPTEGWTDLGYYRWAGEAVYQSSSYSRYFDGIEIVDEYFHHDTGSWKSGELVPFGSSFRFEIELMDGPETYRIDTTFELVRRHIQWEEPLTCWDYESEGMIERYCQEWSYRAVYQEGAAMHWQL